MEKKLTLNKNPILRTYTHHFFLHSISSASGRVAQENECVAQIEMNNFKEDDWTIYKQTPTFNYSHENNQLSFFATKWNLNMNMSFFRPCKENDTLSLTIKNQFYSGYYSSIKLFCTSKENLSTIDQKDLTKFDYGYVLGNFCGSGVYCGPSTNPEPIRCNIFPNYPITLKIQKQNNSLFLYYKDYDNQEVKKEIELDKKNYDTIGFAITFGNNKYYEWTFSNYINTYFIHNAPMHVDFSNITPKNYTFHIDNFFTYVNHEHELTIKNGYKISLVDYIKSQIDLGRYVEVLCNDNINHGEDPFDEPFFHQNLFYGYNDEEKYFYNLYTDRGKPFLNTFSYDDLISKKNEFVEPRHIFTFIYSQTAEGHQVSAKYIKKQFSDFLNCVNTMYMTPRDRDKTKVIKHGINMYKHFLHKKNIPLLFEDIRISHFFYERSNLNALRVEYLHCTNFIKDEDYEILQQESKEITKLCLTLRNFILKSQIRNEFDCTKIIPLIKEIIEKEIIFTKDLIKRL